MHDSLDTPPCSASHTLEQLEDSRRDYIIRSGCHWLISKGDALTAQADGETLVEQLNFDVPVSVSKTDIDIGEILVLLEREVLSEVNRRGDTWSVRWSNDLSIDNREQMVRDVFTDSRIMARLAQIGIFLQQIGSNAEAGVFSLPLEKSENEDENRMIQTKVTELLLAGQGISYSQDSSRLQVEVARSGSREDEVFLHSRAAKALLNGFDQAGMTLTDEARAELVTEHDQKYGNAYAWITREVVKIVADKKDKLFEDGDYAQLDETDNIPADTVNALLMQVAARGNDRTSQLQPTKKEINIRDGGCADVEINFARAVATNMIVHETIEGVPFLTKGYGDQTMLSKEPVQYFGVVFPAGTLWKRFEDGGFSPLRISAFAFEPDDAKDVFAGAYSDIERYDVNGFESVKRELAV